ncbi:hypothetical protein KL86DYS1_31687 [uncultured Dysgonomonas sp.]|uniref:Uncharacterized protein n=1 Tax=uncultured Dysgonomonas sp. TaxID=206096 RepID=A0A212K719_9BACT|nr:hypothetical protein KL86DYS1_31687 [uncultured Dysgonomonas sp.]
MQIYIIFRKKTLIYTKTHNTNKKNINKGRTDNFIYHFLQAYNNYIRNALLSESLYR